MRFQEFNNMYVKLRKYRIPKRIAYKLTVLFVL